MKFKFLVPLVLSLIFTWSWSNGWGQAFTGTYSFASATGNIASLNYNGTAISNLTVSALVKTGVTTTSSSGNSRATGWDTGSTDGGAAGGNVNTGKYYEFSITAGSGYTISNPTLSFGVGRSGTGPRRFQWRWDVDTYASPLTVGTANASLTNTSGVLQSPDANSGYTGNSITTTTSGKTTITFRFYAYGAEAAGGNGGLQGNLTFGGTLVATPTISTSGTLSAVNTTYGTASASPTSFTVTGSALNGTEAVTVTPPAGFQVATSSDFSTTIGTSASALSLGTATSIASTTIYVRLAATTIVGAYSGNIVVAGGGATSQNVATVSSAVSKKALTITAVNQSVAYGTAVATVTGNGSYTPTGFVNSETSSVIGGSASYNTTYTTTTAAGLNVATITPVTTSLTATNYSFTTANGNISVTAVTPSAPSITGITSGDSQLGVAFSAPSSNGGASITNYEYSTNGGGNWTTPSPAVTTSPFTISGLTNGTTYDVQIRAVNSAGSGGASTTVQGTPAAPSSPTISGAATATAFITTYGTASTAQNFSISGSALTADIIATAPTGFEVSNDGTTYGSTATFTQGGGSASGTLRIRLTAAAAVSGSYNSQNIVLSSTGASSINITTSSSGNTVSQKALAITTATVASKVYNQSTTSGTVTPGTLSGFVGSETVVVSSAAGTYADWNIGTGKTATISYTLGNGTNGGLVANYSLANTSSTGDITAKTLTVTSPAVTSKTYDGNTNATITGTLSGVESGDVVSLTGTGTFAMANVGTGIVVTSTSTLGGADAGNYTLTQPTGLSGNITGASQTITFASLTPATLSTADYSPGATASSGLTVTYTSSNPCVATIVSGNIHIVGTGTTTITASQIGGGNYAAASSVNQTLSVMNPTSTLTAGDVVVIAYNTGGAPDNFALLFNADLAAGTVFYVNDNELASTSSTSFTNLDEGEASFTVKAGQTIAAGTVIVLPWGAAAVSATQYDWSSTSGAGLGNGGEEIYIYIASSITSSAPSTFISYTRIGSSTSAIPSSLALGTTAIAPNNNAALRYATSGATYSGTKATLLTAIGNTSSNWNTTGATSFAATDWSFSVSPSPLITSSGTLSAVSTTYGTASASPTSFSVSASNLTADLTLTAPSGFEISSGSSYATSLTISPDACGAIAATSIDVRLAATTSVGAYSGNIVLSSTGATSVNVATVSSTVSAKALTIIDLTATDKTYDGLTTVTVSGTPAYSGLVNSESFSVSGTVSWAFPNATVENNKTLTRTGNYAAPSANYTVTQPTLTASITTRSLTITANNVNKPFGDVLTGGSGSTAFVSSGLQNGETIGSVTIAYGNGSASTDAVGTYTGEVTPSTATGGTFTAANYSISYVAGNIIVSSVPILNPVTLTSALSTTYGTASSGISFVASGSNLSTNITLTAQSGYQVSDDNSSFGSSVSVSSGTTVYVRFEATKAAGTYNNATAVVLSSAGATDVNISTSSSGNIVSAKPLTISGISISNKVYDGNATATISGTAAYSGLVNGESFAVSGTPSATFSDKNVGTNKTITVIDYSSPSSNYSFSQPSGILANITTATLTITSAVVSSKVYDGSTVATITGTLSGVISPDAVTLVGTGTFASANVGTGISVTSITTLSGADAGNYSLTQPTGLTGEITKANQTITFGALPNKTTADVPFNLTATASSGLTVSYTSSDITVASIVGNTVTIVGVGTTIITASQNGNSNYHAASNVAQTLTVTLADIEEIIFPQYIQGVNGTNSNRIPSAYYLKLNNLNPNTTYRFFGGFVTASDLSTSSGAGNNIYVNYSGGSFTRSSSTSLSTASNYGTLTTNANGSYTGWFVMEPTGNAARFVPGTNLFFRVSLNDGNNGTTAVNYRTSKNTTKVINLVASAGANNGTGLYSSSSAGSKNFAVLYDNTAGTDRPISASYIEDDGSANTSANSYSSFYNSNVNSISGAFGVVIPNNNSNGIKRIEFKKTSDNSLIYAVTDNDGNWNGTANTVNPTGGTTAISLPHSMFDDAIFNESAGISLAQNTTVNSTLSLLNGTLNVGANTLTVNGTLIRTSGNIDASNASATVVFSGSSAQTIPSSSFTGNINNLTLNNSQGLTTNQNLTVTNVLTLSNGVIDLQASDLNMTSNTVNGGSATSYIKTSGAGALKRNVSSSPVVFPVGNSSYNPATLTNTGTVDNFSVRVIDNVTDDGTAVGTGTSLEVVNRTWMIDEQDAGGSNVTLGLNWNSGAVEEINNFQPTSAFIAHYISSDGLWDNIGGTASTNSIVASGITSFSPFTVSSSLVFAPLPVELISFHANCNENNGIILTWTTASEHNTSHYVLEKSRDGIEWSVLGQTAAAGNSTQLLNYELIDSEKANGIMYYRLTQFDNDGKYEVFNPVSVNCNGTTSNNHISTYPNPSDESFFVSLITETMEGNGQLTITDASGRTVFVQSVNIQGGNNVFHIGDMKAAPGMYYIQISNGTTITDKVKHSLR